MFHSEVAAGCARLEWPLAQPPRKVTLPALGTFVPDAAEVHFETTLMDAVA